MRGTRARSAAVAGIIASVAALGANASHAAGDSPTAPEGLSPGPEIIDAVNARARDQWIARQNRLRVLATPEQRQARRASRTAFKNMGREAAARLARQTFGDVVTQPAVGPLRSGQRADEYVGDFAARVHGAAPDGENAFVVSGQPLRVRDEAGKLAPVDITLQRGANGWAPKNPMERYVLGETSSEGLTFSDTGVTFTPQGAAVPGRHEGETVLYAETNTDTDTFVKPLPDGAEFLWQLRSGDSPEELLLSVDLPPRAELKMRGDGSVALVRDGKAIGAISAPVGVDANQEPVDTSMRVAGSDTVAVAVQHRKANPAYPILVDPVVRAGFYFQYQGSSWYGYWGHYVHGPFDVWRGQGNWGNGLNITSGSYPAYRYFKTPGWGGLPDRAGFYYPAPGRARIFKMYNTLSRHILGEYAMCMLVGITRPDGDPQNPIAAWDGPYGTTWGEGCAPFGAYGWTVQTLNGAATPGNALLFGVQAWDPNYQGNDVLTAFWSFLNDAEIYIEDDDDPLGTVTVAPSGWTSDPAAKIKVEAQDQSTGVRRVWFTGPAGWIHHGREFVNPNCTFGPCSQGLVAEIAVDNLPEGENDIIVWTEDAAGRVSTAPLKVRVDRTTPTLGTDGPFLWHHAEGLPFGEDDAYEIWMSAEDGTDQQPKAGVDRVEVLVDGVVVSTQAGDCAEPGCPADLYWDFDPASVAPGSHSVQVVATDEAGHQTSNSWTIQVNAPSVTSAAGGSEDQNRVDEPPHPGEAPNRHSVLPVIAEPGASTRACTREGLTLDGRSVDGRALAVVNGAWSRGFESTEYFSADRYRVFRCDEDGEFLDGQELMKTPVPEGGESMLPVETYRRAGDGTAVTILTYPAASDSQWKRDRAAGVGLEPLAPTVAPATLPAVVRATSSRATTRQFGGLRCGENEWVPQRQWPRGVTYRWKVNPTNNPRKPQPGVWGNNGETTKRLSDGLRTWEQMLDRCHQYKHTQTSFNHEYDGVTTASIFNREDGINTIGFSNADIAVHCPGAVGCTRGIEIDGKWDVESGVDIILDGRDGRRWNNSRNGRRYCNGQMYDVWNIATHEAGHVVGLNHVPAHYLFNVMKLDAEFCDIGNRVLGIGEAKGLMNRHPG